MISIVVPTVDIGMLNATLPGWIDLARTEGEVIVVNGSEESPEQIKNNLSWMKKGWDLHVVNETGNNVVEAMYQGYSLAMGDMIVFLHDDVLIYEEGWDYRIQTWLSLPGVGLVGFGGCSELSSDTHTAGTYLSNWIDAEFYGVREDGDCAVAHVDGQCLALRKYFLDWSEFRARLSGVQQTDKFLVYDAWFSCMVAECGMETIMVGVKSYHTSWLKGDGIRHHRSITPGMAMKAPQKIRHHQGQNLTVSRDYLKERFKKILPIKVTV